MQFLSQTTVPACMACISRQIHSTIHLGKQMLGPGIHICWPHHPLPSKVIHWMFWVLCCLLWLDTEGLTLPFQQYIIRSGCSIFFFTKDTDSASLVLCCMQGHWGPPPHSRRSESVERRVLTVGRLKNEEGIAVCSTPRQNKHVTLVVQRGTHYKS